MIAMAENFSTPQYHKYQNELLRAARNFYLNAGPTESIELIRAANEFGDYLHKTDMLGNEGGNILRLKVEEDIYQDRNGGVEGCGG